MQQEKKERWGAYIKFGSPSKILAKGGTFGGEYLVKIGRYDKSLLEKGEMFTSSSAISKRIKKINEKRKLKGKVLTGCVSFWVGTQGHSKSVNIVSVVPFTGYKGKLTQKFAKQLMGIGLASRIELNILKDLQKKFPKLPVRPIGYTANKMRIRIIDAKGSNAGSKAELFFVRKGKIRVPMQEEIQKIADYIGLKGMKKRKGAEGVRKLLAARERARARKPAARKRPR